MASPVNDAPHPHPESIAVLVTSTWTRSTATPWAWSAVTASPLDPVVIPKIHKPFAAADELDSKADSLGSFLTSASGLPSRVCLNTTRGVQGGRMQALCKRVPPTIGLRQGRPAGNGSSRRK